MTLEMLLKQTVELDGSDLYIVSGVQPHVRVHGELQKLDAPRLYPEDTRDIVHGPMSDRQRRQLDESRSLRWTLDTMLGRVRCNAFRWRDTVAASYRPIRDPKQLGIEELGLPGCTGEWMERDRGLILISGAPGSGRSTTLAALVNHANSARAVRIATIEDPIEHLHVPGRALVTQQEVGTDVDSLEDGIRGARDQSADIVMVSELATPEGIGNAMTLAASGHLVLSTIAATTVTSTCRHVLHASAEPFEERAASRLAENLTGILCQRLVPAREGRGRVVAAEVLDFDPATRRFMREKRLDKLHELMRNHHVPNRRQTMNQGLARLVRTGKVTKATAIDASSDQEELTQLLDRLTP